MQIMKCFDYTDERRYRLGQRQGLYLQRDLKEGVKELYFCRNLRIRWPIKLKKMKCLCWVSVLDDHVKGKKMSTFGNDWVWDDSRDSPSLICNRFQSSGERFGMNI